MFTAAVFTIARAWKQPRCASAEWIKKRWYIYKIEYYSAIKRNAFESVLMRWMDLQSIIQSEVSQKEKINIVFQCIYTESRKMVLKNLFTGQQWRNRLMDMGRGEERMRCMVRVTWKLTLPYVK